jgi:MFS transporter, DHA2 family, multidrug resistance protein
MIALDEFGRGRAVLWPIAELIAAVGIGAIFIGRERSIRAPMLPVDLFRRPVFALSVATSISTFVAQTLAYVALPFMFEDVGQRSQIVTGLLITPWPAIIVFVAPVSGRLSDRASPASLGAAGLAVLTVGMISLLLMPINAGWANIAWRMAVCGFGFGFFQSPNNRLLLSAAPSERSGGASGMLSTARLIGQTTGSALVALSFGLSNAAGNGIAGGVRLALLIGASAAAAAMAISLLRLRQMRPAT